MKSKSELAAELADLLKDPTKIDPASRKAWHSSRLDEIVAEHLHEVHRDQKHPSRDFLRLVELGTLLGDARLIRRISDAVGRLAGRSSGWAGSFAVAADKPNHAEFLDAVEPIPDEHPIWHPVKVLPPAPEEKPANIVELAEQLDVSDTTARRLAKAKKLMVRKRGRPKG